MAALEQTANSSMKESLGIHHVEHNGPESRLMIKKMVLENFKSYAGIKEIGPFHKCFSSVVGPNGSGKSNVIDAMLFVFGKRAKKLRLNKVSELIHSSDGFKDVPLQYARVSVHFQDIFDHTDCSDPNQDEAYTVVPNSEIVVTRTARRDNSSSYQLDGKTVPFKHVAEYLAGKGIDLNNNRFLILQGEVEMISMMPPRGKTDEDDDGLLEYLEEIIGSNKYVEETNAAALQVEQLTDARQEKLNRVKAAEQEKDNLESAKLEAEALLLKERDIRRKQNILFQLHLMHLDEEHAEALEQRNSLREKLDKVRAELVNKEQSVKQYAEEFKRKQELHENSMESLKLAKEHFGDFERRDIQMREEIKHSKASVLKLEKKVKEEASKIASLTEKADEAESQIPLLQEQKICLSEQKIQEESKLEDLYDKMRDKTEQLRKELEERTLELAPLQEERSRKQAALDTASTEARLLEDSALRAREQLNSAQATLSTLDERQANLRSELSSAEDTAKESDSRLKEAIREENELSSKENLLSKSYSNVITQVEYTKTALEEARQSGSTADGTCRNKAVAGILESSKTKGGTLEKVGVVGRLGDLCTIDGQYDVAVSTACGMLDHIVTQTTKGAQACLDFLRKENLGRSNFIPLDKMKRGAHDRPVETPENAPRLFDLIQVCNPALLPALYLAVGNTLVAPDLETATRWAYDYSKRWRVVTVDGKLIETSGTMAGGGNSVRTGGMRLVSSKKSSGRPNVASGNAEMDAAKLEKEYVALEKKSTEILEELNNARSKRRILQEEIKNLGLSIKALRIKIPKLALEIKGCDTTREELTLRLPTLKEQSTLSSEDEVRLSELKKKVQECKNSLALCVMKSSKLEGEVTKLQKAVLNAGGPQLKKQQDLVAKLGESIDKIEADVRQAQVGASSARKNSIKAEKAKESAETELEDIKSQLESLTSRLVELEEKALVVKQAFESEKIFEAKQRDEMNAAIQAHEKAKEEMNKLTNQDIEISAHVDVINKTYKEFEQTKKHWNQKLDALLKQDEECEAEFDLSDDEEEVRISKHGTNSNVDRDEQIEQNEVKAQPNQQADKEVHPQEDKRERSLPQLSKQALKQYDISEIKNTISVLEKERDTLAKTSNMGAIAEYRKKEADYLSRVEELDAVTETRNQARKVHEDLRRQRLEMFMEGFGIITLKLKEMYQMITLGGDAELELVDSLDPFSEGIVFSVRPPKKSWKNISNLSGGEKTLSSLALVFALHHYRPTPLYVMDEIDAALDFKNVSIVANYIKDRTKNAQFIIISLRNNMFELADRLVGIYKTNNCTKSITINPAAFTQKSEKRENQKPFVSDISQGTSTSFVTPMTNQSNTL